MNTGTFKKLHGYGKPTSDDHSDTIYSQLKVFIPASWDLNHLLRDLGVVQYPKYGVLRAGTSSSTSEVGCRVGSLKQAILREAKVSS